MARKYLLAPIALLLSFEASPAAWATGGFSCEVKDKSVEFDVSGAMSRGMAAAILEPRGTIRLKLKGVPEDMRSFDLSQSLVHHWTFDRSLNLDYYVEREGDKPFGHVELIIQTRIRGDDDSARGRYIVRIYTTDPPHDKGDGKTLEIKGRVSCFVE
jgi:hypothetical protein